MTPYVIENLVQYDLSEQEASILRAFGFIVDGDGTGHPLEVSALIWDDLGLEGDRCFDLFDAILGRGDDL